MIEKPLLSTNMVAKAIIIFILMLLILRQVPVFLILPIFILICIIGFRNKEPIFIIIAGSIVIPDDGFYGFSCTQVIIIIWIIHWIFWRNKRITFTIFHVIKIIIPLILWLFISAIRNNDYLMLLDFLKAFAIVIVASDLIIRFKSKPLNTIKNLVLGLSLILVPFYFQLLFSGNIDYSSTVNNLSYIGRSGVERYFTLKQDPNALSVLLNILFCGSACIALFELSSKASKRIILFYFSLAILSIAPIIYTASRGGYISFILGLGVIFFYSIFIIRKMIQRHNFPVIFIYLYFSMILLFALLAYLSINDQGFSNIRTVGIISQVLNAIKNKGLDDRAILINIAWNYISSSPIFGVGYEKYLNLEGIYSHNTFLDVGLAAGLLGILLFILTICYPIFYNIVHKLLTAETIIIYNCLFILIIGMMSLSLFSDKLLWILWTIPMVLIISNRKRIMLSQKNSIKP